AAGLPALLLAVIERPRPLEPRLIEPVRLEVLLLRQLLLLLQAGEGREKGLDGGVVSVRLHRLHQLPALLALGQARHHLAFLREPQLPRLGLVEIEQLLALLFCFGLLLLVLARPEGDPADGAGHRQKDEQHQQGLGGLFHDSSTGTCGSATPPVPRRAARRAGRRRRRASWCASGRPRGTGGCPAAASAGWRCATPPLPSRRPR